MNFQMILSTLGLAQFAPSIAQWFMGTKAESIANRIIHIAKEISGSNDIQEMIENLKANPHKAMLFQEKITAMETEVELALIQDRQEARQRELQILLSGKSTYRGDIMVISAVLGLGLCLCSLGLYGDCLPGEAVGIISTIAGIFGACLKDAYAFEFGSSRGSRQKDQTMAAMMEQL